jgi:dihydroorotase
MNKLLIKGAQIVNRGKIVHSDILVGEGRILKIAPQIEHPGAREWNATGLYALPGIIDDQVHFREPGLTHKAEIYTEARAAVAGGVTSYMEMPNTKPGIVTQELLEEKYQTGARRSLANYSFYMGTTNDNLSEVLSTNPRTVCGVKIFMGSSTGDMLVDAPGTLEKLFANCQMLVATHCEDEHTIRANEAKMRARFGERVSVALHPKIRSAEGCLKSSRLAVELASQYNTRLHILHISTRDELDLFRNDIPLSQKRITSEVCVHHLYFNSRQYGTLGTQIKCNPAIKSQVHQQALFPAMLDDRLDIIATDHAPHTWEEKMNLYFSTPSGLPLVQHSLNIMLDFFRKGKISLERIVEKMCHAPAVCFQVADRGYLDEGAWADIVLVDLQKIWRVDKSNIHYKCQWSPLEGKVFTGKVMTTFVNGHPAYHNGSFDESKMGMRLEFRR